MGQETTPRQPGETTTTKDGELTSPLWARELSEKYRSGVAHGFLLHGNIHDVIGTSGQTPKSYLSASFGNRTLVVCWDRATGFTLPTAAQRRLFAELAGIPASPQPAQPGRAGGGLAAGLNQHTQDSGMNPSGDLIAILRQIRKPEVALEVLSRVLYAHPSQEQLRAYQQEERGQEGRQRNTQAEGKTKEDDIPFRVAVIIDYAESIIPAAEAAAAEADRQALVTLASWGRDPLLGELEHIMILITNELHDINVRLQRASARWEQIRLPFPSLEERADFLRFALAETDVKLATDTTIDELARKTTGMRCLDLEDIVYRAKLLGEPLTPALVKLRKDEILKGEFEDVLAILDEEFGFEALGGMEEIKRDLTETIVVPMRTGALRIVPMGLLFMGPAGTGKTRLARALAKEAGVTFVELQPSKLYAKWVGDTERRLERALEAISAWRPCLVFIDEIDQAMARGESGDSGVSQRVFKRMMEVMADPSLRGHVLFIGATNRPDLMDPALLRPGRFDKHVPILAPDQEERAAILEVLTRAAFPGEEDAWPAPEVYQRLAEQMKGYTGAEIEAIVGKAAQLLARAQTALSIGDALTQAFERILPTTQEVEEMTDLALRYVSDLDLVPQSLRERARQLRHPQARRRPEEAEEQNHLPARRTRREREL